MEEPQWTRIYSSSRAYEAEMYRGLLEENDIRCILVNKQDSAYLFGEVELYVNPDDVMSALRILNLDQA